MTENKYSKNSEDKNENIAKKQDQKKPEPERNSTTSNKSKAKKLKELKEKFKKLKSNKPNSSSLQKAHDTILEVGGSIFLGNNEIVAMQSTNQSEYQRKIPENTEYKTLYVSKEEDDDERVKEEYLKDKRGAFIEVSSIHKNLKDDIKQKIKELENKEEGEKEKTDNKKDDKNNPENQNNPEEDLEDGKKEENDNVDKNNGGNNKNEDKNSVNKNKDIDNKKEDKINNKSDDKLNQPRGQLKPSERKTTRGPRMETLNKSKSRLKHFRKNGTIKGFGKQTNTQSVQRFEGKGSR